MSILKLLGRHTFDVNDTKILASAFDVAWLSLQQSGGDIVSDVRSSGTRELLAHRIIEIAQRGERDREQLVNGALAQFAASN